MKIILALIALIFTLSLAPTSALANPPLYPVCRVDSKIVKVLLPKMESSAMRFTIYRGTRKVGAISYPEGDNIGFYGYRVKDIKPKARYRVKPVPYYIHVNLDPYTNTVIKGPYYATEYCKKS